MMLWVDRTRLERVLREALDGAPAAACPVTFKGAASGTGARAACSATPPCEGDAGSALLAHAETRRPMPVSALPAMRILRNEELELILFGRSARANGFVSRRQSCTWPERRVMTAMPP